MKVIVDCDLCRGINKLYLNLKGFDRNCNDKKGG